MSNLSQREGIKVVETFRVRYECKVIIIASGGKPRITGAANEDMFLYDKGISFCATCDAAANTGKQLWSLAVVMQLLRKGCF